MKTQLNGRAVWYDGVVEVSPADLPRMLLLGVPLDHLSVTEVTPDIVRLNITGEHKLVVKSEADLSAYPPRWSLPDRYIYLDLDEYLEGLADKVKRDELYERRLARLAEEIDLFLKLGLHDVLRGLIFIVEELTRQGVVWGVGRGSSCSSYLLYLIGLHEVDPVRFDIPITDFIRQDSLQETEKCHASTNQHEESR